MRVAPAVGHEGLRVVEPQGMAAHFGWCWLVLDARILPAIPVAAAVELVLQRASPLLLPGRRTLVEAGGRGRALQALLPSFALP